MQLQNGDVLFMTITDDELSLQIANVSAGINHVGIYYEGFIIEAIFEGVVKTPVKAFIAKTTLPIIIAKTKEFGNEAAIVASNCVGFPYNHLYIEDDKSFYCSELIHYAYRIAAGRPYFKRHKLNFLDNNNNVANYWQEYYMTYNMSVPLDCDGSNPGNLLNDAMFISRKVVKDLKDLV